MQDNDDPRSRPRWRGALRLCPAILGVLVLTVGCDRAKDAKKDAPPPPPPQVVVAEVVQRTVPIIRDFTARTDAIPTVEVRARIPGVLEQVLFKEGTEVKQGQTLFVIQRDEYAAALESARAQLAKAQADLTRARDTSIVDRARAQVDVRKAELGKAQQDVNRYRPLAEARAIPQQDLDTSLSQEKVAVANVEAADAALRDSQLVQRTEIQLAEAAVQSAKASMIQAELNLGYTTVQVADQRDHRAGSRWTGATWWARASPRSSPPSPPWTRSMPTSPSPRPTTCGSPAGSASIRQGRARDTEAGSSSCSWRTTASSHRRAGSSSSTGRSIPRRGPSACRPRSPTRKGCCGRASSPGYAA